MKKGKLYGVGVGPGDPELLTLKAARLIKECDIIAIPVKEKEKCFAFNIAAGALPGIAEKDILSIDMPMTRDMNIRQKAYEIGAELLCKKLDEGKNIVFLTIGDPTVYSTYFYLHKRVTASGYETGIVPGVTSFCAAAAVLKTSLCEDNQQLHIIPGIYEPESALDYPGVKVLMKNNIPATLKAARKRGINIQMVENCGAADQRIYRSTDEIPPDAGYYSLMIIKETE